ncbi:MAG: AraC family transcriptional regulator [Fimbriimonadaceae bacterium]|nr:helix-turn-helix transcriptional regulator [Chthonomonadaceae bacterium]MCO5296229.1 AraC family transcriptional regulator [Fimbriimonadaceae bacterium]
MLIVLPRAPAPLAPQGPETRLNAVWRGRLERRLELPRGGQLVLVLPVEGPGVICQGAVLRKDRYLLLAPGAADSTLTLGVPAGPAEVLVLWLSSGFIAEMAESLVIPAGFQELLHGVALRKGDPLSAAAAELAKACLEGRHDDAEEAGFDVIGVVLSLMRIRHEAMLRLARHRGSTLEELLPRLMLARQMVEARFASAFTTRAVADELGLSEFHFARLFRAAFDTPLRQFVIGLRLDAARRLLESSKGSVLEIALEVGYSSPSSFTHAFRRRFGVPPGAYRDQFAE